MKLSPLLSKVVPPNRMPYLENIPWNRWILSVIETLSSWAIGGCDFMSVDEINDFILLYSARFKWWYCCALTFRLSGLKSLNQLLASPELFLICYRPSKSTGSFILTFFTWNLTRGHYILTYLNINVSSFFFLRTCHNEITTPWPLHGIRPLNFYVLSKYLKINHYTI